MVVLLNLDDHGGDPAIVSAPQPQDLITHSPSPSCQQNRQHAFVRATACYPIVIEVARSLDLTTLDHLAQTCQQVRANLLQHRPSLISRTLRCANDDGGDIRSLCARDLVGACQKCDTVVCRNCLSKPIGNFQSVRHRRLCKTCAKAPLETHLTQTQDVDDIGRWHLHKDGERPKLWQGPCSCVERSWFCEPCGRRQLSDDSLYRRGWTWRHRFSRQGPGIGEGEQGVLCGRQGHCLAVREVEVEIDAEHFESPNELAGGDSSRRSPTSYFTQEIEGIGGIVKKKVKKRVPVGHVVKEYEDERETGEYLSREESGQLRSWCAHCNKVIPSNKDNHLFTHTNLERVVSSDASSASST